MAVNGLANSYLDGGGLSNKLWRRLLPGRNQVYYGHGCLLFSTGLQPGDGKTNPKNSLNYVSASPIVKPLEP